MAYSSFSSFRAGPISPKSASTVPPPRRIVAQAPPSSILQQQSAGSAANSLDFISNLPSADSTTTTKATLDDPDDDLFAVALSPRSPDIAKSPFSFSSAEVTKAKADSGQS
jgi:hypothetical protein